MNIIDYAILAVFIYFILRGFYDGFLVTILAAAAFFLSWLSGIVFSPLVANAVFSDSTFTNALLYYTEGAEMISSIEYAKLNVSQLSPVQLSDILNKATLPIPLGKLVESNIVSEVFSSRGIVTVGDYFNQTIVSFSINVFSFLIVFAIVRLVLSIIIHAADTAVTFPVLNHFDRTFGSVFGLLRGIFCVFLVFTLVPLIFVTFNGFPILKVFEDSFLGKIFYESNFLLTLIKGT